VRKATDVEVSNLIEIFSVLEVEEIENPNSLFTNVGILDVYPKCLSIEDAAMLLGAEHNARYEHRFVEFFQRCVEMVPGSVYVLQRPIFSEPKHSEKAIFRIEESNDLLNILTYVTREQCFYNIYFIEAKTAIIGNFDLSWPIYSNSDNYNIFNEVARDVNLYIRTS